MKIKTNQERVQGIGIPLMLESIEVKSLEMEDYRMVCSRGKCRHFYCNAKKCVTGEKSMFSTKLHSKSRTYGEKRAVQTT